MASVMRGRIVERLRRRVVRLSREVTGLKGCLSASVHEVTLLRARLETERGGAL